MAEKLGKMEKKLAKVLQEVENISWEQYLIRFKGTKPLKFSSMDRYPPKLAPYDSKWDVDQYAIGTSSFGPRKLDPLPKVEVYFKTKVKKEELEAMSYLQTIFCGCRFLIHKRVIEIMNKICPDDFEAFPVTIINTRKDTEYFEIKDFYNVNVLRCIDAVDHEKSTIITDEYGSIDTRNIHYKEDPWQNGCHKILQKDGGGYYYFKLDKPCKIARDVVGGGVVWHPELADAMPKDSYHWFMTDEDWRKLPGA